MPGGQASHKGHSAKPNVNAPGVVGDAADPSLDPMDELPEELTNNAAHRAEVETLHYPPAMERPTTGDENTPSE
jgi:hypothetical protein